MQKWIGIGRLTTDPQKIETNEKIICKFGFATPENFTKDGERVTTFHTIITWGKIAENCLKYLTKGSQICVTGKVQYRSWEDEKGVKKYATEITAEEVEFLNIKKNDENA